MTLLCFLFLVFFSNNATYAYAQQSYDPSDCSDKTSKLPGSRYTCDSTHNSCHTFLVYRANQHFRTVSDVYHLLQMNPETALLHMNNVSSPIDQLRPGREVLVPITCSCNGRFFQANFSYTVPKNTTLSEVACSVFEGLLTSNTLVEENGPPQIDMFEAGSQVRAPLRCACPDDFSTSRGVRYLVTYPLVEGDGPLSLSTKFGISTVDFFAVNQLDHLSTIYPNTTVLIPLKRDPVVDFSIPNSPPPAPGFLPTIVEKKSSTKLRNLYISGSVIGVSLLIAVCVAFGLYFKALHKRKVEKMQSFNTRSSPLSCSTARSSPTPSPRSGQTGRSSTPSCLSPDLLVGIKYSLKNFSMSDLKTATKDFSDEAKFGDQTYKGMIENMEMLIEELRSDEMRQVIDIYSRINHINIANLVGVCYGDDEFSWSYLIFEFPSKGCLRDLLSKSSRNVLRWQKRKQIAFDIATGLHYLHYCIFPSYAHMNVRSRNIFITSSWRAKLSSIRTNNSAAGSSKGWAAPEYNGSASEKVDIFSFGVVLLELISGLEDTDGRLDKDAIGFLGGGGDSTEGGCFEQLRNFMDPCLKGDYSIAEALCLAVLAKACVDDDPLHRPSTDDVLKVLARTAAIPSTWS